MTNKNNIYKIIAILLRQKKELTIVFFALILVAATLLYLGQLLRGIIDSGFASNNVNTLDWQMVELAIIVLVFAIGSFLRSYHINIVAERVCGFLKKRTFESILNLQVEKFTSYKQGDLMARLGEDIALVNDMVVNFLSFFVRNFILCVGAIILMLSQSPKLGVLFLLMITASLVPIRLLAGKMRASSAKALHKNGELNHILNENFKGFEIITAYGNQRRFAQEWAGRIEELYNFNKKRLQARSLFFAICVSVIAFIIIGIIWLGSRDIFSGAIAHGQLFAFIYYAIIAGISSGGLLEVISNLQNPLVALERIYQLQADSRPAESIGKQTSKIEAKDLNGEIKFQGVTFAYQTRPDLKALDDFSLKLPLGKFLCLRGASGIGKSTLLQLLLRLYKPSAGNIYISGKDIADIDVIKWREMIAYVPQDSVMFSGTIKDNIDFGSLANDKEISSAAEICGVLDFTRSFTDGLNTPLGQFGKKLSGGQKQKIALARALLRETPILLLDEATSAIDSDSEAIIMQNVKKHYKGKSIIWVAHRSAALNIVDKVIELKK